MLRYRIYADGSVVHQDDFDEQDNAQPYVDDYEEISVPEEVVSYIEENA